MLHESPVLVTTAPAVKSPIISDAVYSRREAAQVTGLSELTLLRADQRGDLTVRRYGRRCLYLGRDILNFLNGGGK